MFFVVVVVVVFDEVERKRNKEAENHVINHVLFCTDHTFFSIGLKPNHIW